MTSPAPPRSRNWIGPGIVLAALAAGIMVVYFVWLRPKPYPQQDLAGAMAANTRGVGLTEQFKYTEAQHEFEEAVRLAPDWTPAKVNLAIALYNQQSDQTKQLATPVTRAQEIFREILAKDPKNKHAHYCLGVIAQYVGKFAEAYEHYSLVIKLDPDDPHTWLRLGSCHPAGPESPEARGCFEKALKLDPYLNEARYRLYQALQAGKPDKANERVIAEHELLRAAEWETMSRIERYGEQGKYADVIGRDPSVMGKPKVGPLPIFQSAPGFKVNLPDGARWATAENLTQIQQAGRTRFGGTVVLFDYNRDERPDVFVATAMVEKGAVRNLLLRNDGGGSFTDVTSASGLAGSRAALGAAAADYDNDGFPDIVITGAHAQQLFRNKGDGTFEDMTVAIGLDKVKGICLGCGWADLDQDSDLDLIICRYAESLEGAARFVAETASGGLVVFENVGEAKPIPQGASQPPLTTAFRADTRLPAAAGPSSAVAVAVGDFDGDQDLDVLVLADQSVPILIENDRLMRFRRTSAAWAKEMSHRWNGGLVFVATHGERSDLLLARTDGPPEFLVVKGKQDFIAGNTNGPALRQAIAVDIDMDGWPDAVGLAADGKPVLLHNQGDGRLEHKPAAFGNASEAIAAVCADIDTDGAPDLLVWRDSGLSLLRNAGNGNKAIHVNPTGTRDKGKGQRTNSDGIGCRIVAMAGPHWTAAERTTTSAGIGQSLLPTALGMGTSDQNNAVLIRWPDGVTQAELMLAAGTVARIAEENRKTTSCPVLMTWDGERFVFVTDFLGAGAMAELNPDGSTRAPRPEESVKIEPHQLRVKDGQYILRVSEPMDEVLYLDHFQLTVIDHPADTVVFPDERFATAAPLPTQQLLAFRKLHFPRKATDHRGADVTQRVLHRDRRAADGFRLRSWLGYAEDHSLTLDFGDIPSGADKHWHLVLAGWTEYPYAESIYAAAAAGVPLGFPVLERLADDGKTWQALGDLGFPAGLPRVMTRPLPDFKTGGQCVLRIRTNLQIYCDQVFLAQAEPNVGRATTLDLSRADLAARGFMQEIHPDGRPPIAYDDSKTEQVHVTKWKGNLTRFGDVTELLKAADDRFVISGPGEEVTLQFDARMLSDLPPGWTRSYVLRSRGYSKDTAPTTLTGGQVEPLPFRAMKNYPDFGGMKPPATDAARWHTRPAGGR
jgi:hypothetical protein